MADHPDPFVPVEPLLADVQARARERLRKRLLERGGAPAYSDRELFNAAEQVFARALETRRTGVLLLDAMLSEEDEQWRVDPPLRLTSHRVRLGPVILFLKKRIVLPLTRWLYAYAHDRFERQQRLNETLFACVEVLAIENAELRRALGVVPGGDSARDVGPRASSGHLQQQ